MCHGLFVFAAVGGDGLAWTKARVVGFALLGCAEV